MKNSETKTRKLYEKIWSNPQQIHREKNPMLGWHLGYYEKGVNSYKESLINMNNYVGKLLDIKNKNLRILDAGCGIGVVVIYLADKYPKSTFYGITLAYNEVKIGQKLKKEKNIKNVTFIQESYTNTEFPSEYFDCVYSLESLSYQKNKRVYLEEMNRIIKNKGKLVVIDFFRQYDSKKPLIKNIRKKILKHKNLDKPKDTINTFREQLREEGFTNIKIENLLKKGNVKHIYFYGHIFQVMFFGLFRKLNKENKFRRYNPFYLIWRFLNHFAFKILILIHRKPGYFSITAEKK